METEIAVLSKQGGRLYNEDTYGYWKKDNLIACLVADGAGGHGGGDVAATVIKQAVLSNVAADPRLEQRCLVDHILSANSVLLAEQKKGHHLADMRSTLVLALLDLEHEQVKLVHCGDSRAYIFRRGQVLHCTTDHSLVQQMVNAGILDAESARLHPQRNVLLSALGSHLEEQEITVSASMAIEPGDVLLLCSDGIWEVLGDRLLMKTLLLSPSPNAWLRALDEAITSQAKSGHDNYTALTLWIYDQDESTQISDLLS